MGRPLHLNLSALWVYSTFFVAPGAFAFVATPTTVVASLSRPRWGNRQPTSIARGSQHRCLPRGGARMSSSEIPVMEAEGTDTVDPYVSELPDSFEDSIARMGKGTLQSMNEVRWVCVWRCRP